MYLTEDPPTGFPFSNLKAMTRNSTSCGREFLMSDGGRAWGRDEAELKTPGPYEVRIAWPQSGNRASNVKVMVRFKGGTKEFTVNQKEIPPNRRLLPFPMRERMGSWGSMPCNGYP